MTMDVKTLRQRWALPTKPRPIVIVGAGGIVNDAHLPAYRKAGLPVSGIYDVDPERSRATAKKFGIERVYGSLEEAVEAGAQAQGVFDIAVPPQYLCEVSAALPDRAVVLMQKPMGMDLADARRIRDLSRRKNFVAAMNFQLRFAPMMLIVRDAIDRGLLGKIVDVEFHLNLHTPWEVFPFLKGLPRCEILLHTVHHLDLVRSLLGDPRGVWAQTVGHPDYPDLASTRTAAILNYGEGIRCVLSINHNYRFGPQHESADVTVQGTQGAVRVSLGLLLNYPAGVPETVEIVTRDMPWTEVPVEGRWFPDGFIGTMSNLQRFAAGEDARLVSSYEDAYRTMALVEACYASSASGGTPIPE